MTQHVKCPIRGCDWSTPSRYFGQELDLHLASKHPTHPKGKAAKAANTLRTEWH
jgi:hypothetical protein